MISSYTASFNMADDFIPYNPHRQTKPRRPQKKSMFTYKIIGRMLTVKIPPMTGPLIPHWTLARSLLSF